MPSVRKNGAQPSWEQYHALHHQLDEMRHEFVSFQYYMKNRTRKLEDIVTTLLRENEDLREDILRISRHQQIRSPRDPREERPFRHDEKSVDPYFFTSPRSEPGERYRLLDESKYDIASPREDVSRGESRPPPLRHIASIKSDESESDAVLTRKGDQSQTKLVDLLDNNDFKKVRFTFASPEKISQTVRMQAEKEERDQTVNRKPTDDEKRCTNIEDREENGGPKMPEMSETPFNEQPLSPAQSACESEVTTKASNIEKDVKAKSEKKRNKNQPGSSSHPLLVVVEDSSGFETLVMDMGRKKMPTISE